MRITGGRARALAVPLLFTLALGTGQAHAAPPTLVTAELKSRHLEVSWTLQPGSNVFLVEVARTPETISGGPGWAIGRFLFQNRVAVGQLSDPQSLSWVSTETIEPGSYYAHVGSYDPVTCPLPELGCELEFSQTMPVEAVPDPPFVLQPPFITSVSAPYRVVNLTWSRPTGMVIESIDVATSPAVIADGSDLDGLFLEENVVSSRILNSSEATSGRTRALDGGTYWVQVVGRDPAVCASPDTPECYAASTPVQADVAFNPPQMRSVGFDSQGRLGASWFLQNDLNNDYLEVATSPAVYPSGERKGEFLSENVIHRRDYQGGGSGLVNSYHSAVPIGVRRGFYYVHVRAKSCEFLYCLFLVSDTSRIWVPGPSLPPSPVKDKATRVSSLTARSRQSVRALYVLAAMAEQGTLTAGGTIDVSGSARAFRLNDASAVAKPGVPVRLRLKASKKAQRAVRRALRRDRRVKASIWVIARDAAGNTKAKRRTIKLKR